MSLNPLYLCYPARQILIATHLTLTSRLGSKAPCFIRHISLSRLGTSSKTSSKPSHDITWLVCALPQKPSRMPPALLQLSRTHSLKRFSCTRFTFCVKRFSITVSLRIKSFNCRPNTVYDRWTLQTTFTSLIRQSIDSSLAQLNYFIDY